MKIKSIKNKYDSLSVPVKAAFWYTFCNVIDKGLSLLSTPIFTRIMTEEQYGDCAIFHSWYSIILIFTSLNIFMGGYTKGLLLNKNDVEQFTSSQLSLTAVITCVWGGIYALNVPFWTKVFQIPPHLMVAMFLQCLITPATTFWLSRERFEYHYRKAVIVTLLNSFLCIGISVVAVLLSDHRLEARVYADISVKVVFGIIIFSIVMMKGKTFYNKAWWKYALAFNLPLIPHYLSNYILNQSDRIMIGRMVGSSQAGFYSIAYTISMMMFLVITAVNNAIEPYIYRSIDSRNVNNIKNIMNLVLILVAVMTIAVMAFAPEIIYVFAGAKYMDAIYVIPPIAASVYFIFVYSMYSTVEYFFQRTGFIAIASTISAILNLILNYFGIKVFGYHAAGYTTLICYVVLAGLHYIFYKKIIKKELPEVRDIYDLRMILFLGLVLAVIMVFLVLTYKTISLRYAIVVVLMIGIFIKRKKVMDIFSIIFKKRKIDNECDKVSRK